jgi:hypothetical protein
MASVDEQRQPWAKFTDAPIVQVIARDTLPVSAREPLQVSVVDVNMRFWSMVVFMVKWTLASIPAFLIIAIPVLLVVSMFATWLATLSP